MPAYWIAHVQVTDPALYGDYMRVAPDAFRRFGARFLARGGKQATLESLAYERHIVIEFPDLATARACYESEEYRAARELRQDAAQTHVCIVEGC